MGNENQLPKGTEAPLTWGQLKEIANNLDEDFLNEPVRWWGDERGGTISYVRLIEEEYISTDEGWEPVSVQETETLEWCEGNERMPDKCPVLITE